MSAPLSNGQKRILSQLARRAWIKGGPELDGMSEEDFRHQEVIKACGKIGLRCCGQDDYKIVQAHFLNLLGETVRAESAMVRHRTNDLRVAMAKLHEACQEAGVNISYPAAICRKQFKCELDDAGPKQIWCLVFTVRNRARPDGHIRKGGSVIMKTENSNGGGVWRLKDAGSGSALTVQKFVLNWTAKSACACGAADGAKSASFILTTCSIWRKAN